MLRVEEAVVQSALACNPTTPKEQKNMVTKSRLITSAIALGLAASGSAYAACTGPGAPSHTETKCLTAVQIPGNPLRSYDISWVNPERAEYYLGDRSNKGVDVIDTHNLTFKRTI